MSDTKATVEAWAVVVGANGKTVALRNLENEAIATMGNCSQAPKSVIRLIPEDSFVDVEGLKFAIENFAEDVHYNRTRVDRIRNPGRQITPPEDLIRQYIKGDNVKRFTNIEDAKRELETWPAGPVEMTITIKAAESRVHPQGSSNDT